MRSITQPCFARRGNGRIDVTRYFAIEYRSRSERTKHCFRSSLFKDGDESAQRQAENEVLEAKANALRMGRRSVSLRTVEVRIPKLTDA